VCPFKQKKFNFSEIKRNFKINVNIDSGFTQDSFGDTIKFYKFYDDRSRVIFSLNDYSKGSTEYDLAIFEIKSNILQCNTPIHYNSTRKDFFELIHTQQTDCDTIIFLEQKTVSRYYRFEFVNDTLKHIGLEFFLL